MRRLLVVLLLLAEILGVTPSSADTPPGPALVTGLDLHDGQITKVGDTYLLVGTEYACGFAWSVANTPWCGIGMSTAPSLAGPWSTPTLLFPPTSTDPWSGLTWAAECGATGQGCFNARLIQRTGWGQNDGVWILWLNSPADYSRSHANGYNALGCNSDANGLPTTCGPTAGLPHGSYTKPSLSVCDTYGDFGFIAPAAGNAPPAIVCTMPSQTGLSIEQLTSNGVSGTGTGSQNLAGLTSVESPGGWYDTASGTYVLTYSDPNCAYCAGTGTGYATATSLLGPYTAPGNASASLHSAPPAATPAAPRRNASAASCGGQPRTVSILDGQPYQGIDLWLGTRNEAAADSLFTPLTYTPSAATAGDGRIWQPEVTFPC